MRRKEVHYYRYEHYEPEETYAVEQAFSEADDLLDYLEDIVEGRVKNPDEFRKEDLDVLYSLMYYIDKKYDVYKKG